MLFSIITVTFNSDKTLKRTINSLLNQSISNFEYIIIDGNSTDTTIEIIESYEQIFKNRNISFTWLSEDDAGIYDAFNKGIRLSKGDWISFLGSDDFYMEDALELYLKEIDGQSSDLDFVHSVVKLGERKVINDRWEWRYFKNEMNIAHVGAFHNKDYFKKYGLYDTNYKIAGDYELLLRAKENLKTHWFNNVTAIMADGGISNSQMKNVFSEATQAKIESGKTNYVISKLNYFKWMFKFRIKCILNEIIR